LLESFYLSIFICCLSVWDFVFEGLGWYKYNKVLWQVLKFHKFIFRKRSRFFFNQDISKQFGKSLDIYGTILFRLEWLQWWLKRFQTVWGSTNFYWIVPRRFSQNIWFIETFLFRLECLPWWLKWFETVWGSSNFYWIVPGGFSQNIWFNETFLFRLEWLQWLLKRFQPIWGSSNFY